LRKNLAAAQLEVLTRLVHHPNQVRFDRFDTKRAALFGAIARSKISAGGEAKVGSSAVRGTSNIIKNKKVAKKSSRRPYALRSSWENPSCAVMNNGENYSCKIHTQTLTFCRLCPLCG
jgi:hypothetical protein